MTKKVIAIISILKPVDDTRNFEKIARSVGNTNKYDINIIGFSTKNIPAQANIHFFPIPKFQRTSIKRLLAQVKIFKILLKLKPELIIVTTPELLLVSMVNKIIFGSKIIYDIQENYYRNILYTSTYPYPFRYLLALSVRALEYMSSRFIDHFILAEKVYQIQIKYTKNRSVVIENKAIIQGELRVRSKIKSEKINFVYSGTIAEHYGILDAIAFVIDLRSKLKNVTLTIIGYAALHITYKKIVELSRQYDFIKIIGGNELVPHDQVLMEMHKADFCLLPYQANKSTAGRFPTKLFECLALETPIIITSNPVWDDVVSQNNAGIIHDFRSTSDFLLTKLALDYYGKNMTKKYTWNHEESKLLDLIKLELN